MTRRLGVGIIGLGRRWQRYRLALQRQRQRFAVRAVYDPVSYRAEAAAKHLGCAATGGCVELLERRDVEAVLILGRPWFGLWPLQQACAVSKPVLCAVPLAADDANADSLRAAVEASHLPLFMAHPLACASVLEGLGRLLAERLGPARLVRAEWAFAGSAAQEHGLLKTTAVGALLMACADLFGSPPTRVSALAAESAEVVSLLLDHGDGRTAQVNLWCGPAVMAACRIGVITPQGSATAELPFRLCWRDGDGLHTERRACRPAEDAHLEQFAESWHNKQPPQPTFEDAYRCLTWLRAAWQSQAEGRPVVLASADAGGTEAIP
jgi:predicted dehydrogenase